MFPTLPALPVKFQSKVNAELQPGESIVWAGQPNPNRRMMKGFLLWLFFIPWTAFALFWMTGVGGLAWLTGGAGGDFNFLALFGLPFILIGTCGLLSPLYLRMDAVRTVYVVTNQRILTISGVLGTKYRSFFPEQIQFVERKERGDGSGNLIFARETYSNSRGENNTKELGFFSIPNVKTVERHLENLVRNNHPALRDSSNLSR